LTFLASSSAVSATTSSTFGKYNCTVKSLPPTLKSAAVTGSVQIDCNVSTTVLLEVGVVELDGSVEDPRIEVPFQKRSVAVIAGRSTFVPTATAPCVSTESGNEELATRARVTLSGTVSLWDRTTSANDAYSC
jgi:hypothetical protein